MFDKLIRDIDETLLEGIKNEAFPGGCYAIVKDNEDISNCIGYKRLFPKKEEVSIDTIYDMASLTKVISTTTAVMLLVEQGKLRLSDPVSKYLPRFKYKNVLIWNLLTHSSGLPADIRNAKLLKDPEEVRNRIFSKYLIYETGTKIVYSDCGYILLSYVIDKITNSYESFVKENLFDKLGMTDTNFNPEKIKRCAPTELKGDDYLLGRVHDEKAFAMGGVAGHAGLFSTTRDVTKFIKMILNDGVYNEKKILSKATVDLLFTPQHYDNSYLKGFNQCRSLGWEMKTFGNSCGDLVSEQTILHTGFTGTNMFIDRKNKVGFVLLTNAVHPTRESKGIIPYRPRIGNKVMSHLT